MKSPDPSLALGRLRAIFGVGTLAGLTDRRLLEKFNTGHREAAEAAFAALVERHGPMVLRVSRGVLRDPHDIDDAFQATFLVLVRKADSLWVRESLAPWLHGVALRVATKARVAAARRRKHEHRSAAEAAGPSQGDGPDGVASMIHEEVGRLPSKYRAPIVLCYLEGMTHDGAATTLGWPVGTVRGRLARARDLLRARLARRGLAGSVGALLAALEAEGASSATPPESCLRGVLSFVAERSAGVAPAAVAALAEGGMMTTAKPKIAAILLLVALAGALGLGRAAWTRPPEDRQDADRAPRPARADAAAPDKPTPESWPAGVEVSGRVVDHRGEAVPGADVLLLGAEQLTVYADPGPGEGLVRYNLSARPAGQAASTKTDGLGRFSLRRPGSPADRIAVASPRMPLWEVTCEEVKGAKELVITLPEPVELAIRAEIPGKPATQEFWAVGRPSRRVDWGSDSLFYRGIDVPNPGERVVRSLPPAQYALERINMTPQGDARNLMTPCERRLLRIEPGKRADVAFERKAGRPVEGRVRGLEGVKLRYAFVTVGYLGPEEFISSREEKSRQFTHFDVLVVGEDGRFTTPPLPANRYEFRLSAMLAATPILEGGQGYDLDGTTWVDIPEEGEIPPVEIDAERNERAAIDRGDSRDPKAPRLEVRAFDEAGAPIEDFRIRLYGGPPGPSPEAFGVDGLAVLIRDELKGWSGGDLIVTAPGFASELREFGPVEGPRKLDVTLSRGVAVRLRVLDPSRRPVAAELMPLPQVYLARHRRDAWRSFASGDPEQRAHAVGRTNFLNVRRAEGGDFALNVRADLAEPLYLGFSHPDVLKYFEAGPVAASDLAGGTWDVVLPEPATLDLSLARGEGSPFAGAFYELLLVIPGQAGGVPLLEAGELEGPEWRTTLRRLAPGAFQVHVQTKPRERTDTPPGLEAHPGIYRDLRTLELAPGERAAVGFDPPPFDPDAWRGERSATVVVDAPGDRSPGGEAYRVSYALPNYGPLAVASGALRDDGTISLEGIAASEASPIGGQYTVEVAGEYLGQFRVEDRPGPQEFTLRMPVRGGDVAPDGEAQDLETGETVRLDDFRGRVVFLEFWATWCGPCREPMQKLTELGRRRGKAWGDDVALVAVSIDEDRDAPLKRIRRGGLTTVRHLWSPRDHAERASSAYAAYSISGVPTSFLIDREGRIVWRGHPASIEVGEKIEEIRKQATD